MKYQINRTCPRWTLFSACFVSSCIAINSSALAANFVWNAGSGSWPNAANWLPFGVPGFNDNVFIGAPAPGLQPGVVSGSGTFHSMNLSNGMVVDTAGGQIGSLGVAQVSGNGTGIIARLSLIGINEHDFSAHLQLISPGTWLELRDNAAVRLFSTPSEPSYSVGEIRGQGFIDVIGSEPFKNNGTIRPTANGGLTIRQSNGAGTLLPINLDGPLETGQIIFDVLNSLLVVEGSGLSDSFSGFISMAPGAHLQMSLTDPWELGLGSQLNVTGNGQFPIASRITGAPLIVNGNVQVGSAGSFLRLQSPTTFQPFANISIHADNRLRSEASTIIQAGAVFALGSSADLEFVGVTTVQGGVFNTPSESLSDGFVRFDGQTTWNGTVTVNGAAMQNGIATVSGPTTINADRFDMDGLAATTWNINQNLMMNVGALSVVQPNHFEGTFNLGNTLGARLTMNLNDPAASWHLDGTMNIAGNPALFVTRLDGSRMVVEGNLNVLNGRARVNNDIVFSASGAGGPAEISINPGNAVLRTHGNLQVEKGVLFSGNGSLSTADNGYLLLEDEVIMSGVGVINGGLFEVEHASPGIASVGHFTGLESGIWQLEIGGYLAGAHHDIVQVNGLSNLDGKLSVDLIDLGIGFDPQIGDSFTILSSLQAVSGQFSDNHPISYAAGHSYQWEVLYHPHDVKLRLVEISELVPEPGTVFLMICGLVCMVSQGWRRTTGLGELPRKHSGKWVVCIAGGITEVILLAPASQAATFDWNSQFGQWSDASKWTPNGVPGVADLARIGSLPIAEDADAELDVNAAVRVLQIENGMRLRTNGRAMIATDETLIFGSSSRTSELEVENSTFTTDLLTNQGRLRLSQGNLNVNDLLINSVDSLLFGGGTINLYGAAGSALRNDGRISTNGSPFITVNQLGDALMDLDGVFGEGHLDISTGILPGETVTFNGTQLSDSFSGTIELMAGSTLNMNFQQGWTSDPSSVVKLLGNKLTTSPATLAGGDWTLAGELNVVSEQLFNLGAGQAFIEADTVIANTATVFVESDNSLLFDNVTIEGGFFEVQEDADLTFGGATLVRGGQFQTHSLQSFDGAVRFDGTTIWDGDVGVEGIAIQNGNAQVAGLTHIDAGVFDMDGGGGNVWNFNHVATITAQSIDSTINNTYDGTINVNGLLGRLIVELTGAFDKWTMNGELNLTNLLPGVAVRIDGATMRSTGVIHSDGRVRVAAPVEFAANGEVHFSDPDAELWMEAQTLVEAGALFIGSGTLRNRSTGELTLANGATLDDVGVVNDGLLLVGNSPGIASVDRFENTADGTWLVEIGGHLGGIEHDVLQVTAGDALLGGLLDVELIDTGSGLFLPLVGDEFTVLTAVGDVIGMFVEDPVSYAAGHSFHWEVLYHPHDVTLRLAEIGDLVPEPNSALLMVCGIGCMVHRKRRCSTRLG